jgi:RNA recognition motif-containing protein
MEIRISNLNSATTENDVRQLFAGYRVMLTSQIKTIADGPKTKTVTYCFVSIDNRSEGEAAIQKLNGTRLRDTEILVQEGR